MFTADYNCLLVKCPRDIPAHDDVLNLFKTLTPTNCQFSPIKVYPIDSRRRKSTCRWKVLYVLKDCHTNIYIQGQQARELKQELLRSHPINCSIVDYDFFADEQNNLNGWLFIWKVHCEHNPNFLNNDNILHTEELPIFYI